MPSCAGQDESGPDPSNRQSKEALDMFPKLSKVLDRNDLAAVQSNEVHNDFDFSDRIEDLVYRAWPLGYPDFLYSRMSVGPAQMQLKQIDELKTLYPAQLANVNPLSAGDAQKLIAAYMSREAERFDKNEYAPSAQGNPRLNETPAIQRKFASLQQQWNTARGKSDSNSLKRILFVSYNAGLGEEQANKVEATRNRLHEILPACYFD